MAAAKRSLQPKAKLTNDKNPKCNKKGRYRNARSYTVLETWTNLLNSNTSRRNNDTWL